MTIPGSTTIRSTIIAVSLMAAGFCAGAPAPRGRPATSTRLPFRGFVSDEIGSIQDVAFADGSWYLADPRNGRIGVLDANGRFRSAIGRPGAGPGELAVPRALAAAAGRVYVSQLGQGGIVVFDTGGRYVTTLRGSGRCGVIVQLAAVESRVFALRRCLLPDKRVRLLIDVNDGDHLAAWSGADTLGTAGAPAVPLTVPLIAVDSGFVVFGEGTLACLHRLRVSDAMPAGERCLAESPRVVMPDSVARRIRANARGRLSVPQYMPRALRIALVHGRLAALVPEDADHAAWRWFDWSRRGSRPVSALESTGGEQSFLTAGGQLLAGETDEGMAVRVVGVASR